MKRFNLIKKLLAMLLILVASVTQAKAEIVFSGGYIYFDNSLGINPTTLQICARQSGWTGVSTLSNISNTKLYYVANPQGSGWGGILGWVVISANPAKSNFNFDDWTNYTWCSDWNTYGFNSGSTYLIVPSSTSKSQSVTTTYYSGGYSALNSTQTINTVVKTGSGSYTSANSKATISITSYEMTGNGAVTKRTPSLETSAKSQTVSAARTATTTLSVGTVASGYQFDGWYTAATGGTQLSSSTTYTYYPTAATTVYARFSEKMSTVTLSASPSGKGSFTIGGAAATSTTAGVTTTRSVTAVPISGYHFVSWAITGGASISSTTTNPTIVTGGGAGIAATLTATFAADDVYTLTVAAGTGISAVTGTTNNITAGQNIAITATVATGYTWSTWTKTSGSGTLSTFTAGTKNQTVTVGTAGDITLTASATEKKSTLTTSNHYDAGNPGYAIPTKTASPIGIATTATLTATTPSTGYTFAGWTLSSNLVVTSGNAATDRTITVRTDGNGAAATAQANYEEDLSTPYVIKGGSAFGGSSPWWNQDIPFTKKSGESTGTVAYAEIPISATVIEGEANTDYNFKVIKDGSTWLGINEGSGAWWYFNYSGEKELTSGNDIQLRANVVGTYIVKLDYTTDASKPKMTIYFPPSVTWASAASIYSGDAATISASVSDIVSGKSLTYEVFEGATATGVAVATYNTTTTGTTDSHDFSITPTFGASDMSKQYTVKITYNGTQTDTYTNYIYRKWDIYVHDVQNWNQIKLYMWKGEDKSAAYPGALCPLYNSSTSWYTVTLDGRYSEGFVLSADGDATKTANHTPSISSYESGTYWYVNKNQGGTLTSVSITDPTVVVTSATMINTHQIKLIGNVTNFGGDGSTSGELKEVGFYLGETKYTAGCTSNSNGTFTKVITNLTAGTPYTIKAFATNIHGTAQSATQNVSTRADGTTRIKVRSAIARSAPKIHVWTSAEDCGGVKEENAASLAESPAMTLFITGSVYKWYYYDISNDYNHFQITDGDVSVASMGQANPFDATCYWYHPTEAQQGQRLGTMTCPYETPQLMIETTAGSGTFEYYEMTGSGTVSKTMALSSNSTYEFKPVYNAEWYSKTEASTLTRESNTTAALNASDENNLSITTDFAGDYTFSFNTSTKVLSVTYPEAFKVTYNANSASGGSVPTESGTYYLSGNDVTLATNHDGILYKEGYAFNGWNTAPGGGGTHYDAGGTLSSIGANTTLYAEWVANDYTMYFFNKDSWSSVYAYMWDANNNPEKAWHGRAMTSYQSNVYKIDYRHDVQAHVKFNDNSSTETGNLTIADGQTGDNWFYNPDDASVNTGGIHHGWSQYILVANFPTSTAAAVVGEKVTIVPTVVWADGINFADINITSTRASGSANINAVVSGTNIIVSGTEEGTATFNITYTYLTHTEATITKTLTVKVMNGLTIQAKVPSDDDHWVYSNIVKMHYWGGAGTDANPSFEGDVTMSWIKDGADGKYYQACVPVGTEATPKTNFIFFYDNFNDAWRKTQDITNVTANSCYTINHTAGLDNQRNAVKEGTGLCNDSWSIQITMGSGDIYTSNIVETSDEIVSFFAPSNASESKSYRQGVVTIEHNGASVATVPASTFAASGVYTAKIDMTNPASPSLKNVALYDGNYYIRTDGAAGGWDNYKTNPANLMTEFTRNTNFPNETFSYYWVNNVAKGSGDPVNIKATVANDINPVLCNFSADDNIAQETHGVNLRFGYEPTTNDLVRGIVGGSTTNNFLNVVCADGSQIYKEIDCETLLDEAHYVSNPDDSKFADKSNWVYEIIVYAKIDDTHKTADVVLKSFYKGIHYLLGMVKDAQGHDTSTPVSFPVIKTGTTNGVYGLRVVYDFKTNRLFAAWAPADRVIDGVLDVDADVMFIRHEDGDAAQISFKTNASRIEDIKQAIFALELDNEKVDHGGSGNIERHYFISLPFDCKVSNIFGIGGFMNYWGIQRYNGAKRAQIGWFQETPTFWEWLSPDDVMRAGEGYLLSVDKKALENGGVWNDGIIYQKQEVIINPETSQPYKAQDGSDSIAWVTHNDGSMLTMYFPSTTSGFIIAPATGEALTIIYPDQPCSITREDRDKKDSNWKCIGTPGYKNVAITDYAQESPELVVNAAPRFLYEFHEQTSGATWAKGTYTVTDGSTFTYHSFNSYMVQFAGTINWAQYSQNKPNSVAPRRVLAENEKRTEIQLNLLSEDSTSLDRAFVWLQEEATIGFDQNLDLNKMIESKANQMYSLAENDVPFAANVLPLGTDTVPLVVNIANEGEYAFSLNVDKHVGMAPILYDMYKSEQINLLNSDYLVELEKGKYEDRFFLLFQPEAPIVTSFESTADGGQNVHSLEAIYDVLGRRVNTVYPGHLYIVNGEKRIAK